LKNQRVLDEARRLFYVAVTRARQRLVMSGLARQDKQGNWQGSGDSPWRGSESITGSTCRRRGFP